MARVLLTGGAGYIGTHIACALAAAGRTSVSIDNYSNSSPRALERVESIAPGAVRAFEADLRNTDRLARILEEEDVDSVIHLAGLKAVDESIRQPQRYHDNNVGGARSLLAALSKSPVRKLVFSSSATVYGVPARVPIDESMPVAPMSPYGENKLEIERLLAELPRRDPSWRIANLRYFNPVGAH